MEFKRFRLTSVSKGWQYIVDSLSECSIMELPIRFQNFYIPLPLSSLIVTKQKCCYCQLITSRDI